MELVYLVIVLALVEYMVLSGMVGYARGKHGVKAPDCVGPDAFNRTFRVQQNTLEGLVIFLPGLWLFGSYVNPMAAAGLGIVGIIGRALYAKLYIAAPEKRGPGAAICGIVNMVLILGSLIGVIRALF